MENASKALIMAAEILIGVLIISIGVYLFNTLGKYSAETTAEMEETQLEQYNNQFLKYYGTSGGQQITCTIHDIIGLANLANKINTANNFEGVQPVSDTSEYIEIDLKIGVKTYKNLETMPQDELVNLIKENDIAYSQDEDGNTVANTKQFICKQEPGIGTVTKKVNYMLFEEYKGNL